ncbi:c-type cytochrome [Nitrosophilus alvini]|uniref:c-type cytochrome n=1 Tax=Nitrosophilus alvini TaxID=2714855 RepID=UPI00190DCA5A|nr:c-type cytochrome [Nitrosophilus alvini]
MRRLFLFCILVAMFLYGESLSDEELKKERAYQALLKSIADNSDPELLARLGKRLYNNKCIFCHGEDGKGRDGFAADLTKRIDFKSALHHIQKGGHNFKEGYPGSMPPMVSNRERAAVLARYVSQGFPKGDKGEILFQKIGCANCHGEDGSGIKFHGPNIRYFDLPTLSAILRNGKKGVIGIMPSFKNLSPYQITMISYYVMKLSEGGFKENRR